MPIGMHFIYTIIRYLLQKLSVVLDICYRNSQCSVGHLLHKLSVVLDIYYGTQCSVGYLLHKLTV